MILYLEDHPTDHLRDSIRHGYQPLFIYGITHETTAQISVGSSQLNHKSTVYPRKMHDMKLTPCKVLPHTWLSWCITPVAMVYGRYMIYDIWYMHNKHHRWGTTLGYYTEFPPRTYLGPGVFSPWQWACFFPEHDPFWENVSGFLGHWAGLLSPNSVAGPSPTGCTASSSSATASAAGHRWVNRLGSLML
jgi:hypothetical protein